MDVLACPVPNSMTLFRRNATSQGRRLTTVKANTRSKEVFIPFVHPAYVRVVLDYLASRGVRPATVLERSGLTWQDLRDGQPMVGFAAFRRFVSHAVECSGEPALGVLAGANFQPYHSPVGIGALTSDTLGQGLEFLARYARLIFAGMEFELDNGPRWSIFKVKSTRPLCEAHFFLIQSIVGTHGHMLEAILGRYVDELVVGLPYPRPTAEADSSLRHVRSVVFDQPCLTFQLPVKLLEVPSVCTDPTTSLDAARTCQRMQSEQMRGEFVQRVRHALLDRLMDNPDVSELAADLDVSVRKFMRRLVEAGANYSDIKDEVRRSHSAWYLKHTELSIESIASQLGYTDPTSFGRKFKGWYGMTPSKMRQASRIGLN
ncbi:MAG: AraC family transcriptional regulator ligand-binding domain-containing protein [Variovorax sp.]|nr:AraC family transcriptional regulator ligand-binding domain-containing protein [Variovorax sp.]